MLIKQAKSLKSSIILVCLLFSSYLVAQDKNEASAVILQKLTQMEKEIATLKEQLKVVSQSKDAKPAVNPEKKIDESLFKPNSQPEIKDKVDTDSQVLNDKRIKELGQFGITYRSAGVSNDTMRLGAYGESVFGRKQSGDGWNNGFDAKRIVLLGTYPIAEDIIFNTEIEFEHGGIAKDADDKLNGAIEVEQVFVDFRVNDNFTWRSPGVDIVPVGYVGLFHEPTQFYSTNRPEIYAGLIPATWFTSSTGAYGKIVDGLNYQFQISSGLEDAGTTADEEGGSVPTGGYDAGISGSESLKLSRSPIGDNTQLGNSLGYALRLAYETPIKGLAGSSSIYYTGDVSPRGAYGTDPNGTERLLGSSNLALFDTELRYRIPKTGFELRTEYVHTALGNPDNLRANNDGDVTNNVGDAMYGYSFETAYHMPLSKKQSQQWDLVPFYRYSRINLQTGGAGGSDIDASSGAGEKDYHTVGFSLFPTPKVVLKIDYQLIQDSDNQTADEKALLGSVGFFF